MNDNRNAFYRDHPCNPDFLPGIFQYSQNAEMNTWINEAEKIINKESLLIDTEKLKVKNKPTALLR